MKLSSIRLMTLLALSAGALLMTPPARAATSVAGDLFLGVRAKAGTGSNKTYVINLGQATLFENASSPLNLSLGAVGTDLSNTFGSTWFTKADVLWGIAGSTGTLVPIGSDPVKTMFGTRTLQTPWVRANDATHGAATNKVNALLSAFNSSSAGGATATNAVVQTTTDSNSWATFQPGGPNSGPLPGTSFAFFNPSVEASFGGGVAGAVLHFYRVKPAAGADIGTNGDYLGRFLISSQGKVTFVPVAANGANTISIENATYSAGETDGTFEVKVVRSGDFSVPASVTIAATGGTATSEDYTFTGGVVSFAAGEAEKIQTITIADRDGFQGDRTIVLSLSSPTGGTLGTNATSTVTITEDIEPSEVNLVNSQVNVNAENSTVMIQLERSGGGSPVTVEIATTDGTAVNGVNYTAPVGGAKTVSFAANATTASATINLLNNSAITANKRFTVALENPGANASIGSSGPASTTVRILAADAVIPTVAIDLPLANAIIPTISGPQVTISGTATDNIEVDRVLLTFNGVLTTINTTGTPVSWSRNLNAVGGVNTISVRSVDARGNTSAAVTRSFTYVKNGGLTVLTNPVNSTLGSVTGALTGTNPYQVGKTYTLKATPKAGSVFLHWEVPGLTGAVVEGPVLTFVYSEAILATPIITAYFGPLPFDASKIGEFNGLVSPHDEDTISSNSTNGAMKLTLTKTGSFSGSLLIDGFKLTIPASLFTGEGNARFGLTSASTLMVARTNKPSLELSNVKWNAGANTITGVVKQYYRSAVTAECDFTLDRAGFSAANKLPADSPYLANAGLFTVILRAKEQSNGLTAADYPQGDGIGSITISNAGIVKLAGKLADDTAITASVPLSSALKAPLFAQLYTNKGSFSSLVQLNSAATDSDLKAVNSLWFRPWQNVQWYPWGWEEGVAVDLLGASYVKTGSVIRGVQTTPNNTTANAELAFSDGLLSDDINANVNISPTNVVKTLDSETALATSFTLALKAASGDISGTFTHSDGTKPKFTGKVYQKGPAAGAYGYFMTLKPKIVDGLGQSGGLSLTPIDLD